MIMGAYANFGRANRLKIDWVPRKRTLDVRVISLPQCYVWRCSSPVF